MRATVGAPEICVEVKLPKGFVSFDEQFGLGHTGVVDDYIGTSSKVRAALIESLVHRFSLLHITLHRQRISSELGGNFLRDSIHFFERASGDGDTCAFSRECDCNRAANASAATGDECQASRKFHVPF
jgi:hypothetical protein